MSYLDCSATACNVRDSLYVRPACRSRGFSELSASTRRTPPTVLFASMLATALLATGALLAGKPARCASAGRRMATSAPQMSSAYGFSARDLATGSVTELSVRAACLCQLVPCSLPGG